MRSHSHNNQGPGKIGFILGGLLVLGAILFLPSCGHKKSKDVGLAVLPEVPIVITANSKDVFGTVIAAPWFSFRPVISNGSDTAVTIISLKLAITGTDTGGNVTTVTREYVPSGWAWSRTGSVGGTSVVFICAFTHFGVYLPNTSNEQFYLGGDSSCPPCDTDGAAPPGQSFCAPRPLLYFGGGPGGPTNNFTTWTVQMTPTGWFGGYDDPQDRFTNTVTFRTQ